jgi:hypothetical protein
MIVSSKLTNKSSLSNPRRRNIVLEVDLTEVNFLTTNHRSQYDGKVVLVVMWIIPFITLLIKGKIMIRFELFRMRHWIDVYEVLFGENHRNPKSKFEPRKETEASDSYSIFEKDLFHVDSGNQSETTAKSIDSVSLDSAWDIDVTTSPIGLKTRFGWSEGVWILATMESLTDRGTRCPFVWCFGLPR